MVWDRRPGCGIQDSERSRQVDEQRSRGRDVRRQVGELVSRAEAIVEALEATAADGRWVRRDSAVVDRRADSD